jgi:hypothetical protein
LDETTPSANWVLIKAGKAKVTLLLMLNDDLEKNLNF